MTIRIGVLGNGFARSVMLPAIRHVAGVEVVAIASPDQERLAATAREFGIPVHAPEHHRVLDEKPDLVLIATPPHRHLEQARDALAAGCHVICEKPTALDATESSAMLAASAAHPDRLALMDHELRFDPRRVQIREWIREGRLGRILRIDYRLSSPFRRRPAIWNWWSDADAGGGVLGAIGSHVVDACRDFLGEVSDASGVLETFNPRLPDADGVLRPVTADEFASFWLRFESGVIGTVTLSTVEAERQHEITITGTRGGVRWSEQHPLEAGFTDEEGGAITLAPVAVEDPLPSSRELGIPETDWARCFLRYLRRVVAAIERGELEIPTAATFEDGHRNQRVLDQVRRTASDGYPCAGSAWE